MTRLTKELREQICESIMKATHFPALEEGYKKKLQEAARSYAKSFLPKGFEEKTKNLPREWFGTCTQIHFSHEFYLSSSYAKTSWRGQCLTFEAFHCDVHFSVPTIYKEKLPIEEFGTLLEDMEKCITDYEELKSSVRQTLASFTTVKSLLKQFPEFERHVKVSGKSYPVSTYHGNVTSALMAAGFDTGVAA